MISNKKLKGATICGILFLVLVVVMMFSVSRVNAFEGPVLITGCFGHGRSLFVSNMFDEDLSTIEHYYIPFAHASDITTDLKTLLIVSNPGFDKLLCEQYGYEIDSTIPQEKVNTIMQEELERIQSLVTFANAQGVEIISLHEMHIPPKSRSLDAIPAQNAQYIILLGGEDDFLLEIAQDNNIPIDIIKWHQIDEENNKVYLAPQVLKQKLAELFHVSLPEYTGHVIGKSDSEEK